MGNLVSLFLLSMLTTEPETSHPGEITFLEQSCSTQVQQTPLLMRVLGSTPLLGQKRFHLGHKVPDECCFQSKAEKVLRRKQFLHFPFQRQGTWQATQAQNQNKCSHSEGSFLPQQ